MKFLKGFLISFIIGSLLIGGIASAQIAGGNITTEFWKRDGDAIFPINSSWDLGSTTQRISKIWADDGDFVTVTLGGVATGDINLNGNAITFDTDDDSLMQSNSDDTIDVELGGTKIWQFNTDGLWVNATNDGFLIDSVRDFWAFRYDSGIGLDNTGVFFDALTDGAFEVKINGTDIIQSNAGATSLNGGTLNIGTNSSTTITFAPDGTSGELTWNTSQNRFDVPDDMFLSTGQKIMFGNTGRFIDDTNGVLNLDSSTNIRLNTGAVVQIGDQSADLDYRIDVFGEDNTGQIIWMEDENYFDIDSISCSDRTIYPPTNQEITAVGNTITVTSTTKTLSTDGSAYTLTSTPTVADGVNGQIIYLIGTDDSDTITIQDAGNLANSGLALSGGTNFTLGESDVIQLVYDSGLDMWQEITRSDN